MCELYTCKFIYSFVFFCSPKTHWNQLTPTCFQLRPSKAMLRGFVSALLLQTCAFFQGILSHIFYICVLCVGGFNVWNRPKHHSEVLSCVFKHRQVLMCLRRKIHILDKLHVGMSYRPVSRSSMLINKKIHIK